MPVARTGVTFVPSGRNAGSLFGAFSYSRSHVPAVCTYIEKQEEHHRKKTFLTEYKELLNAFEIEFDEAYLFKPFI